MGPADRNADDETEDDGAGGVEGRWIDVNWRDLLNTLFWNLNYYDSVAALSGDCEDPAKNFPTAMAYAVLFVTLTYLLPLSVATGALPRTDYCDGCFVSIAADVAGEWLGGWISVAAAFSCVGLIIAEMAGDSFQIMGMADNGLLPKVLSSRSQYETPTVACFMGFFGVIIACPADFTTIIEMVRSTLVSFLWGS